MQPDPTGPMEPTSHSQSQTTPARPSARTPESATPGNTLSRRATFGLLAAGVLTGSHLTGCNRDEVASNTDPTATGGRSDVPLRIGLFGSAAEAEAIERAWSLSSEQPLAIEVVASITAASDPSASDPSADRSTVGRDSLREHWQDLAERTDVLLISQRLIGEVVEAQAAVEFQDEVLESFQNAYGKPLPAVANGLGNYGGRPWAVPVGAKAFALLTVDPDAHAETWAEYHALVESIGGNAAEPLAAGWAAASFLHRAATTVSRGWLFDRNTMVPEITEDAYRAVLTQMAATAKRYVQPDRTPQAIWSALRSGEIRAGISYETPLSTTLPDDADPAADVSDREVFDISVSTGPMETQTERVWFPQDTPLVCISSGSRQTAASKQFAGWLSGGEQTAAIWRQTRRFSGTRRSNEADAEPRQNAYARWLLQRLQTLQVVPGLSLPGGSSYYDALDRQVRRCCRGEASAETCLAQASEQWESITERFGRNEQTIAWKRSLGFGG